ncbi:hypothetical protein ACWIVY_02515 [Ursidibacter sp. B-7004-1]
MYQNKTEKNYTEQDFKSLLVSRVKIEEVLGLTINQKKNNDNQYLDDYSLFPELHLHNVVCIFLGLHPKDCNAEYHPRYEIIYEAIKQLAETGKIKATVKGESHFKSVFLPHATARAIAQSQGFDWNVPPYKDIVNTNTTLNVITQSDNSEQINILQRQINVKNEEITQLQARIAELEKENQNLIKPEAVDYDERSIYGHSTEAINAIFGTIERFWINADLTQPDTVANAEDIEKWIGENYNLSNTLKTAVQKITRPEEARYLGRKS